MKSLFFPVILAGGSGTRLWPLSRKNFPKQFLRLQGESSLLQATVQRALTLPHERLLVVSNEAHYFLCQEQLHSFSPLLDYLLEPGVRNTAPAIACAAHHLMITVGKEAMMLVFPADHWIENPTSWREAILAGAAFAASSPVLVTFGIKPTSAKTGYGYIEAGEALTSALCVVKRFREKPDLKTAEAFLKCGHYYWNSGMFVCQAGVYLDELQRYAPDIYAGSKRAVEKANRQYNYWQLEADAFLACKEESIDYAIMEKTDKAVVMPLDMPWSDLGCWTAVAEAHPVDGNGNALQGRVIAKESRGCLISSQHALVTTLGIQDQIVVATADAVLVADKRYSQQVKDLVNALGKEHEQLAYDHPRVFRPWGYYEVLAEGPTFKVKRLMVKPGARLSLQMHQYRAEHWVVVEGEAEIINGDATMHLGVNQSTYIPEKTRHRLSNMGTIPLYVIEVQSGNYLGEDDILRFDDIYQRKTESSVI